MRTVDRVQTCWTIHGVHAPRRTHMPFEAASKVVPITPAQPERSMGWWTWEWQLLSLVAVALAYASVRHAGFVWDDNLHVTANPTIIGPQGLREIWATSAANYFPLTLTSFRVLHAFWGLNPLPYHVANVAMHIASALLLWRLLHGLRLPGAWLGATLWAVHPVQAESVAWISQLKNTQSAAFFLLSTCLYVQWLDARVGGIARRGWYAAAFASALLAFTSKSSTVMLPAVLGLIVFWRNGRWQIRDVVPLAPFLLAAALVSGWTIWEQKFHSGAVGADWTMTPLERLLLAGRLPWFYLGKLAWPAGLAFVYPRWEIDPTAIAAYFPLAATWLVTAALWWWRREARGAAVAWGCFLALLFPVLGFFDVYYFRYAFAADHFQYLASMAPLALLASGGATLARNVAPGGARTLAIGSAALLVGLGLITSQQARSYHDAASLWRATLATNPTCWLAWNNLGRIERAATGAPGALSFYEHAVAVRPDFAEAQYNVGTALMDVGDHKRAAFHLRQAIRLRPSLADAHNNLANVFSREGNLPAAFREYAVALKIQPASAYTWRNFGLALEAGGRLDEAVRAYAAAISLRPNYPEALGNLGSTLLQQNRVAEAIACLESALRANPTTGALRSNYAVALNRAGRLGEAAAQEEIARQLELPEGQGSLVASDAPASVQQ